MTGNESPAEPPAKDHADVVALPPIIYLLALGLGLLAQWLLPGSIFSGTTLRVAVGAVAIAIGIFGMLRFVRAFNASQQDRNPNTSTPSIVSAGVYAYTRNPAYVSLTLLYAGVALMLDNVWMFVFLAPVLVLMHYGVILREERYLERKFGEEYLVYKRRVRRWI